MPEIVPAPTVPEWQPLWPFTGDLGHVRILASRLADPSWFVCPAQQTKKSRPEVYPVRDRSSRNVELPPFAAVPIGLVRSVIIDHVTQGLTPTPESIEQAAMRAAAPRELAAGSALAVQAAVNGYRELLRQLRSEGSLGVDAVLVADLAIIEPQVDDGVVEWSAWGINWIGRDGVREFHVLTWRNAGRRPKSAAQLAVMARTLADGVVVEPTTSFSSRHVAAAFQPPATTRVRIREIGLLDGSSAVLFDAEPTQARASFEQAVPAALALLNGDAYVPGKNCATCVIRQECSGLARVAGVLGVAGRAPYVRALSTSDLWQYSVCPQRLHLTADLGLPQEPVPEFEGMRRGKLVHSWLESAHARGITCAASDLPQRGEPGPIGEQLGWSATDADLVADFLGHHLDNCPITQEPDELVRPEVAMTVHDTDADVVFSTRPDLVIQRTGPAGKPRFVVRETKTLNLHRLSADVESALIFHFPQVAAALCLLAAGVNPLNMVNTIDPAGSSVELELLGNDGATVVSYSLDDPDVVLAAQVALAEQIDHWIHDDQHQPRPGRQCDSCPVRSWCPVTVFADQGLVNNDGTGDSSDWAALGTEQELPRDVLALIEADASAPGDEEFPF